MSKKEEGIVQMPAVFDKKSTEIKKIKVYPSVLPWD